MKGLDDHEDGLNDAAFDAALSAPHNRRQSIPVITYETKFATDLTTRLHRYRCAECCAFGAWLEQPEVVRANAAKHVGWHADGRP